MSKVNEHLKDCIDRNNAGDDVAEQDFGELEFLETDHSSTLKSSRNVCELLEKVREQTEALEEQVGSSQL